MIKVGLENISESMHLFAGKRVGLITNPTGVDREFRSTIDILSEKVNLVALFSPEHGIRGNLQAGVELEPYIDEKTGAHVYSLYGKTRRPTKDMLEGLDVLVFDIQDVGARYYTYLYTMAYAMSACAEYDKHFVVLDRPNPVDGIHVEGNILNLDFRSFVGYYPIVQRYGLTIGELAMLFNHEYGISCKLDVVKMMGWERHMDYQATGRLFVQPSPNIPTTETMYHYLATCLFEGTNMSEGRGTTKPFSLIGAPWLKANDVIDALKDYDLRGVSFRAQYFTPMFSKHQGVLCHGIELYVTDKDLYEPVYTGYVLLDVIRHMHQEFEVLNPYAGGRAPFINLLTGDRFASEDSLNLKQIKEKLEIDREAFLQIKERYHIYEL